MNRSHCQSVHIDNGGISMSIVDKGIDKGIWFEIATEYFGHPGLHASMQLDEHAIQFLNKLEEMIRHAKQDLQGIDWEGRYSKSPQ